MSFLSAVLGSNDVDEAKGSNVQLKSMYKKSLRPARGTATGGAGAATSESKSSKMEKGETGSNAVEGKVSGGPSATPSKYFASSSPTSSSSTSLSTSSTTMSSSSLLGASSSSLSPYTIPGFIDLLRRGSLYVCVKAPCGCACAVERLAPPRIALGAIPLSELQRDRVRAIRKKSTTAYDPTDSEHTGILYSLGVAVFGTNFTHNELVSPKWKTIGFQGTDPSTDFRGAGLFGLQNLHYLVHIEPRVVKRMTKYESVSSEHYLPFAISSLNMTFMLLHALFLNCSWGVKLNRAELDVYLGFCGLLETEEFAFEEVYKSALQLLDDRWMETHARYIDFQEVLGFVRERVCAALAKRPVTVFEFNQYLAELDQDGDISISGPSG